MKISNGARLIFWVAAIFALGFLVRAESGERRARYLRKNTPRPIRILDQNGRPAVSGIPSPNGKIVDVTVGPGFAFHPDTVNISVGDTVRWTWGSSGHSVTSGPPCAADSQYCSPNDTNCFSGSSFQFRYGLSAYLPEAGSYSYHCLSHCVLGMTGVVNVTGSCAQSGWSAAGPSQSWCRLAGVYFQANGKFYAMGGRSRRHSRQRIHSSV